MPPIQEDGKGILVISLDTELEWGFHGLPSDHGLSYNGERERENIKHLLSIFEKYDASITWAIVGHLFLSECDGAHIEMEGPSYPELTEDWYADDPGTSLKKSPLRYAPDIIKAIIDSPVNHEIGSHMFSHVVCRSPGCDETVIRNELEKSKELAANAGVKIDSVVFPRNEIGFLDVLVDQKVSVFRGRSLEDEYRNNTIGGRYRRYIRFLSQRPPTTVRPVKIQENLWKLPASVYFPYNPVVPDVFGKPRVERIKNGLRKANRKKEILHLWAHPHNFNNDDLRDLELILDYANDIGITITTMKNAVERYTRSERPQPYNDGDS